MRSTKRCLPVLALGLVFFFTSTLAADVTANYPSTLNLDPLPCINNAPITVTGPTAVNIQSNSDSDGTHVVVHVQIRADGQDDATPNPNPYHVNLEGTLQFTVNPGDTPPSSYDVPFHSQWVGQGTAVNFPLTGVITVSIDDHGNVSTAVTKVDLPTCTN